jgi:hypothetical protein
MTFPNVLHNTFTNTLGSAYPATTPSLDQYLLGSTTTYTTQRIASLYSPGQNAYINAVFGLGEGTQIQVTALGVSNSILGWNQLSSGTGSFINPVAGGFGSQWWLQDVSVPNYSGTKWVGTERTVSATIKPTNMPGVWKIQTASVVMR